MHTHSDMNMPLSAAGFRRIWLLATTVLFTVLIALHASTSHAQTFDRQQENQRYQQWLEAFRQDFQTLRQSPDPATADVDAMFAKAMAGCIPTRTPRTNPRRYACATCM
jgi:hypothetical protein